MQFNEIYEVTTNEDKNEYHFTTSLNYHYNVYFLPAKEEYFSEYPDIPDNIYLFGFSLLNTGVGMMPFDSKIAQTICRILVDFFDNHKNIIIFISKIAIICRLYTERTIRIKNYIWMLFSR